jgi:transcriptional regulator with XRE-family HTH domain
MNAISKEESDRMLVLLEDAVRQSPMSVRKLERKLGVSQGYLASLFRGRIQLKLSHVYGISHALEKEPLSFFLRVSPPESHEWLMEQLEIGGNVLPAHLRGAKPLPGRQEMLEIVRTTIREELERIFAKPNQG